MLKLPSGPLRFFYVLVPPWTLKLPDYLPLLSSLDKTVRWTIAFLLRAGITTSN